MKVLICTNGSAESRRAFEAGALVAWALHVEAVVLGVVERPKSCCGLCPPHGTWCSAC